MVSHPRLARVSLNDRYFSAPGSILFAQCGTCSRRMVHRPPERFQCLTRNFVRRPPDVMLWPLLCLPTAFWTQKICFGVRVIRVGTRSRCTLWSKIPATPFELTHSMLFNRRLFARCIAGRSGKIHHRDRLLAGPYSNDRHHRIPESRLGNPPGKQGRCDAAW